MVRIKHPLLTCLALVICMSLSAQTTYNQLVRDTIITHSGFLAPTYLLNGKKLNLTVMQWFMSDYPVAYDPIRAAVVSDQLSVVSYSIGGLIAVTGLLVIQTNEGLGREMLMVGGGGLGGGLILQFLSAGYQKKAVREYNQCIRNNFEGKSARLEWGMGGEGLALRVSF
jgi:hypothetical protein